MSTANQEITHLERKRDGCKLQMFTNHFPIEHHLHEGYPDDKTAEQWYTVEGFLFSTCIL